MLIFDEIEKAHPKVINLFLQVLDAGTLYDNKYEANIAFGETVIIFTTNAGKSLYQDTTKHNYSDVPKKVILDALEKECHPVTGRRFFRRQSVPDWPQEMFYCLIILRPISFRRLQRES